MACTLAVDATSALVGAALSATACKSRSVPIFYLRRAGVVVCGSLTLAAFRTCDTKTVAKASAGALAVLVSMGRWDNARAELAPRWEPHGRGASDLKGEAWAALTLYATGAAWACALKTLVFKAPLVGCVVVVAVTYISTRPGVSTPGGPRPKPIGRRPQFDAAPRPPVRGWRCATGAESHAVTARAAAKHGVRAALTGESAGRQIWHYVGEDRDGCEGMAPFDPARNPNASDQLYRRERLSTWHKTHGDDEESTDPLERALRFYQKLQVPDGHWGGDYGGPHFLSPGLVVMWYVTGRRDSILDAHQRKAMKRYYENHQQLDGGWGTHVESPSTMFGTTLTYVALRLLGEPAEAPRLRKARTFIHFHGGATFTASWAKFALCLLGAMDWAGHESVPPEMWLLPAWCPFHPGRMWCHARMVYLPMGYLWGSRFVYDEAETDATVLALRRELYPLHYEDIDWVASRACVAPIDDYSPVGRCMRLAQRILRIYEASTLLGPLRTHLRRKGLAFSAAYCRAEDLQTNFIAIGPVNKVYNMLVAWDRQDGTFDAHCLRVPDYLWVAEDGLKMQGYNGSQCWDLSFATQAIAEAGLGDAAYLEDCVVRAWSYLERTQILSTAVSRASPAFSYEDAANRERYFRHVSRGGWPFSTSAHGWPISDCTAEGLKSVLALRGLRCVQTRGAPIADARLFDAINVVLALQNADGGFATYECNRGYGWYEWLNPSEVFGDIMIDYSYVECSMASNGALARFREAFPGHRRREVDRALKRGNAFLRSIQRRDGSWYGSWGCCFTYAGWFGIEGLVDSGEDPLTSEPVRRACAFLLRHQRPNGGWGEDFTSCFDKAYAVHGMRAYGDGGSGVVPTAWALLGLMAGGCADRAAVQRGVAYLERRQLRSGNWPQEGIAGVFNRACGITYTAYRNVFPAWALARHREAYAKHP
jgi:squalene/oxidosqualene cyclase-like protein